MCRGSECSSRVRTPELALEVGAVQLTRSLAQTGARQLRDGVLEAALCRHNGQEGEYRGEHGATSGLALMGEGIWMERNGQWQSWQTPLYAPVHACMVGTPCSLTLAMRVNAEREIAPKLGAHRAPKSIREVLLPMPLSSGLIVTQYASCVPRD
jgi:hypothetical protein